MESIQSDLGIIRILDMNGQLIKTYNNIEQTNTLDVSAIDGGIYLLEYIGDGLRYYKKLMIK